MCTYVYININISTRDVQDFTNEFSWKMDDPLPPGSFASFLLLKVYQICRDNRRCATIYFYLLKQMVLLRIVVRSFDKKRGKNFSKLVDRSIRGTKISLALPFFLFQTKRKNSKSVYIRVQGTREKNVNSDVEDPHRDEVPDVP